MDIPFVDLNCQYAPLLPEIQEAFHGIIERCAFINGPEVKEFEHHMAEWLGVKGVCGVSSGTNALYLTLKALDIGQGDEVITVPNTAFPAAESINLCGANVVFADIASRYFSLDPGEVVKAFIDLFNYLMDAIPQRVFARCEDLLGRGMDDVSLVFMDYNGTPAIVEANYFSPEKRESLPLSGIEKR